MIPTVPLPLPKTRQGKRRIHKLILEFPLSIEIKMRIGNASKGRRGQRNLFKQKGGDLRTGDCETDSTAEMDLEMTKKGPITQFHSWMSPQRKRESRGQTTKSSAVESFAFNFKNSPHLPFSLSPSLPFVESRKQTQLSPTFPSLEKKNSEQTDAQQTLNLKGSH